MQNTGIKVNKYILAMPAQRITTAVRRECEAINVEILSIEGIDLDNSKMTVTLKLKEEDIDLIEWLNQYQPGKMADVIKDVLRQHLQNGSDRDLLERIFSKVSYIQENVEWKKGG